MAAEEAFAIGAVIGAVVGFALGIVLSMWWLHWVFFGGER